MAVLHVYLDESGKQADHPLVAMCCVCGSNSSIQKFTDNWERLLRHYQVPDFHMKRASRLSGKWGILPKQTLEERIEGLTPFADCLGDNLEYGIVEAWDVKGFKAIPAESRKKLGNVQDPFYLAFIRSMIQLTEFAKNDDVLNVICDYDMETAWDTYRHYLAIRKADLEVRKKTAAITFADDKFFVALQAADMMAFLTRHEARQRFYNIKNEWAPLFRRMIRDRGPGKIAWKALFADEKMTKNCLTKRPKKDLF